VRQLRKDGCNSLCTTHSGLLAHCIHFREVRAAELHTAFLRRLKASLGALANHATLLLRERCDMQFKGLGVGADATHEIDPLHQVGNKRDVAAEPVELGYN
jgi:hypothetical protein